MFPWELRCGGCPGKPSPSQLCTGASACSPKGPGSQKLNLAWSRVSLKLVPVCEEGRVWVQSHHPLPAELLPSEWGEPRSPSQGSADLGR